MTKKKHPNSLLVSRLLSLSFHLSPFSLISLKPPWLDPPSPSQAGATHHSLTQILKNFNKICFLPIELSSDESSIKDEILLSWRVDFGSTLDNYVILGSRTVLHPPTSVADFGYLLCLWVKIVWVSGGDYNPLSLVEGDDCMGFAAVGRLLFSLSIPLS